MAVFRNKKEDFYEKGKKIDSSIDDWCNDIGFGGVWWQTGGGVHDGGAGSHSGGKRQRGNQS